MVSLRGPKLKTVAALIALICAVTGVYLTFFHSRGFVKTTAIIVDVERISGDDSSDTFRPTVEFTVDGKTYTGELDESSSAYKIGKTIPILYDPSDPTVVHGGGGAGVYLMIVGIIIVAVILVSSIGTKRRRAETLAQQELSGRTGYAPSVQGEERELYFLTDQGTPKYGHRMEDSGRRVLYEAKMTRFSLTQPYGFDFIDHEHGTTTPHLLGHEEESEWDTLLIDSRRTFELDGVDIWKHLKDNGVSVETRYGSGSGPAVGMLCRILRDGVEIARAESASAYPHEEDAEAHKVAAAIPAPGFFRVWTKEQYLDLLFMTLTAFARSGAGDDRGGSYGALLGTLKKKNGKK